MRQSLGMTIIHNKFIDRSCRPGTRLGYCWIMIEERFPELREACRDPYPVIAEKAVGKAGR